MSGVRIEEITEEDELNNQEPIRSSEYTKKRNHEEEEEKEEKESNHPIIEEPDDDSTNEPSKKKPKNKKKQSSSSSSSSKTLKAKKRGSKNTFMSSMFGDFFGFDDDLFGGFPDFGGFGDFPEFDDDDDDVSGNGGYQCYSTSSSSTVTYDQDGVPHIKEKTSSLKSLNGKVEEKTNTLRDSDLGIEKINLERRIGGKSKKIEKVRKNGGAIESKESVKGMTSEEAAAFEEDWEKATNKPKGLLKNKKSSKKPKLIMN